MSGPDYLGLIASIDRLYQQVVTDPASLGDAELAEWAEETLGPLGGDRDLARQARRALRMAQKLRDHWAERTGPGPADWRSRVDERLGTRAWEPALAIARLGLERSPEEAIFEEVKRRVAEVRFDRWMEGVGFEEWMASRPAP